LKAVADVTKPMPNENCARMLTGHDAISSQSCLVRELHEGQKKNGLPADVSFCYPSVWKVATEDGAPHRP